MAPAMSEISHETDDDPSRCANCGTPMFGAYCAACGQRSLDLERPFSELLREALDAFFAFDVRIWRTLWTLVSRPGRLTLEYLAGRRARYVHPFKLYFVLSVLLFLALALSGYSVIRVSGGDEPVVTAVEVGAAGGEAPSDGTVGAGDPAGIERFLAPLFELMENDPDRLNRIFTDRLAKSVVVLVPVFALLLRLLYRRRPYIAQLIFSLHLHSFAFLVLLLGLGLDAAIGAAEDRRPGNGLAVLAIMVYTFLALRRVSGQGRLATVAKMAALGLGYLAALVATMMVTLAVTAFTV